MDERMSHVVAVDCVPSAHPGFGSMEARARSVNLANLQVSAHGDEADLLALSQTCDRRTAVFVAEQLNNATARSDSRRELVLFVRRQLREAFNDSLDGW